MPEGPTSSESLGKTTETAAKRPEAAKIVRQPKGPSESGLIGMLDAMGDGNTPTPRKSLEALAGANLEIPVAPSAPTEMLKALTERLLSNVTKAPEPRTNIDASADSKQQELTKPKQEFMVEWKSVGGNFSIEQVLASHQKSMQEGSRHVKNVYNTANVQDALKAYRSNPSQETAQKLFDTLNSESGKRQVRWGEARKKCPHGNDPEECPECKKGTITPTSQP